MPAASRIALHLLIALLALGAFEMRGVLHAKIGLLSTESWLRLTETLIWASMAGLVNAVAMRTLWSLEGRQPPRLLLQVVTGSIWVFAVIGVVTVVFGRSVTDLVTASSVLVATVGFSVRALIGDLFSGIALAIERPFEIGDWVQIDDRTVGRVAEINWRSTRLVTRDAVSIVVPNGLLASRHFRNFNRPVRYWRSSIRIRLGRDVPPAQAERLLLSAVSHVPECAAIPERPAAQVVGFEGDMVDWDLRYWLDDYHESGAIEDRLRRAVLHNLEMAGIELPRDSRRILLEQPEEGRGLDLWLGRVDLFAGLAREERHELSALARQHLAPAGMPIVRQGDPGASLFVLLEGFLQVHLVDGEGQPRLVGTIVPGGVFGEMSLLTGAPRAATVTPAVSSLVYEITKDTLEPYLHRHPALAEQMSRILAERQSANSQQVEGPARVTEREQETLASQILARIRGFFGLGEGTRAA